MLEARDGDALVSKLRTFAALNVYSSPLVQMHYRKCMSDKEWEQEWLPSIERVATRDKSKAAAGHTAEDD